MIGDYSRAKVHFLISRSVTFSRLLKPSKKLIGLETTVMAVVGEVEVDHFSKGQCRWRRSKNKSYGMKSRQRITTKERNLIAT